MSTLLDFNFSSFCKVLVRQLCMQSKGCQLDNIGSKPFPIFFKLYMLTGFMSNTGLKFDKRSVDTPNSENGGRSGICNRRFDTP